MSKWTADELAWAKSEEGRNAATALMDAPPALVKFLRQLSVEFYAATLARPLS